MARIMFSKSISDFPIKILLKPILQANNKLLALIDSYLYASSSAAQQEKNIADKLSAMPTLNAEFIKFFVYGFV